MQAAQLSVHRFAVAFHEQYREYALRTPQSWLEAVDGGSVRQVCSQLACVLPETTCCN